LTSTQTTDADIPAPAWDPSQVKILCVDDEPNVLSALRRMFSLEGCEISTADSGAAALEQLAGQNFDVIISDMQMPHMNGAQLLQQVREQWPDTMRLLLTGTADLANAVAAINQGEIYRYISKPWNDDELLGVVKSAVELASLAQERERLTALTQAQNKALEDMVETLEEKVQVRTASLRQAYTASIKAFSGLLGLRSAKLLDHSKRVANTAMKMAQLAGLDHAMAQDFFIAGLLHDLGKIGLSDRVLSTDIDNLPQSDFVLLESHAGMGATCLKGLEGMDTVSQMIRSHHENFDGSGYPDRLSGTPSPWAPGTWRSLRCMKNSCPGITTASLAAMPRRCAPLSVIAERFFALTLLTCWSRCWVAFLPHLSRDTLRRHPQPNPRRQRVMMCLPS